MGRQSSSDFLFVKLGNEVMLGAAFGNVRTKLFFRRISRTCELCLQLLHKEVNTSIEYVLLQDNDLFCHFPRTGWSSKDKLVEIVTPYLCSRGCREDVVSFQITTTHLRFCALILVINKKVNFNLRFMKNVVLLIKHKEYFS